MNKTEQYHNARQTIGKKTEAPKRRIIASGAELKKTKNLFTALDEAEAAIRSEINEADSASFCKQGNPGFPHL